MEKQKKDGKKVYQKVFDSQQPLSTFDLDDEIIPTMLIPSNKDNNDTQRSNIDNNVYNPYNLHQAPLEFFTIYEKGDEEKTFHNEEMEQRSDSGARRNGLSYSEYPTHKLESEPQDIRYNNTLNGELFTPEYYEQLLFVKGESPRVSTEIKEYKVDVKDATEEEEAVISDDYEDVQVEEARYANQSVINAARKSEEGNSSNDYENVEYVKGQLIQTSNSKSKSFESEGLYAMGRRFPSFRIIKGKKKTSKRLNSQEKSNKSVKQFNNPSINSASKETDAIYSRPKKWNFMYKRSEKDSKMDIEKNSQVSETLSVWRYSLFIFF